MRSGWDRSHESEDLFCAHRDPQCCGCQWRHLSLCWSWWCQWRFPHHRTKSLHCVLLACRSALLLVASGCWIRPQNAKADIYTQHLCITQCWWCKKKKPHNLLLILQQNWGNPRMCGFRSKTVVSDIPPSFSFRYPPLTPLLLVRCSIATECVEIRSHDSFIWKRKRKCYN